MIKLSKMILTAAIYTKVFCALSHKITLVRFWARGWLTVTSSVAPKWSCQQFSDLFTATNEASSNSMWRQTVHRSANLNLCQLSCHKQSVLTHVHCNKKWNPQTYSMSVCRALAFTTAHKIKQKQSCAPGPSDWNKVTWPASRQTYIAHSQRNTPPRSIRETTLFTLSSLLSRHTAFTVVHNPTWYSCSAVIYFRNVAFQRSGGTSGLSTKFSLFARSAFRVRRAAPRGFSAGLVSSETMLLMSTPDLARLSTSSTCRELQNNQNYI